MGHVLTFAKYSNLTALFRTRTLNTGLPPFTLCTLSTVRELLLEPKSDPVPLITALPQLPSPAE